jgi:uncharacterized repeat protein (TIGR01451 family)
MNARRSLALLVILASLLLPIGDARAQAAEVHVSPTLLRQVAFEERGQRPEMRVIVSFETPGSRDVVPEPSAVSSARAALLARLPASSFVEVASFDRIRAVSLKVNAESLEILRRTPGVIAINADREVRKSMAQANLLTGANIVHGLGYTGEGQVVAIIDTGVDINGGVVHPALADDLVGQACFRTENDCIGGPTSAEDQDGHGTHVAGIITGPEGVAPDTRFYALKAFTTGNTSDTNILNALNYVIGLNTATPGAVDLVNMSLGGGNYATGAACDADGVAYVNAFATLNAQGTAIFVATGNDAQTNEISSPGCITGAIGVGSTGESTFTQVFSNCIDNGEPDKVSCFSNATSVQGPGELVDLLAPGCSITSTGLDGSTNYTLCGTSMATPYAAGVAALVRGFMAGAGLGATPAQLEDLLEVTGKPVLDYRIAASPQYPRVDPVAAIGALSFAAPPSGFAITGTTATSISMAWAGVPEATAYRVYRNVPGAAPVQVGSTTVPTVTFTDTSAPCGPQTYFVRAFNGTALSLASNEDTGTARACPLTPTSLLATPVSSTAVTLSWNDSNPNETAQILQRSLNGGAYADYQTLAPGSALSFAETGLPCGVYRYRAVAERGGDRSAPSNVVQFAACAPANDNFANAEVIVADVAFTDVEANVSFASEEASDPVYSCKFGGPGPGFQGIWYRITPTVATRVTVSTAGTTLIVPGSSAPDTLVAIYTHDGSAFTPIACNDDISGSNFRSSVSGNLAAGTTYYAFVSQWGQVPPGTVGNVSTQFSWSAPLVVPDNDLVANARVIGAMPYTNTVTGAQNATISPTDLPHSCSFNGPRVGSHTLWWTFTPATDGLLDVDTLASSGSFTDTIMTVYRGAPGSFTEVACNDDEPAPGTTLRSEILDLPLTAGTQYTIYVSRWNSTPTANAGTLVLNASFEQITEALVSPTSLTLNETGETVGNVVFRLSQAPPTNVTIPLTFNGNVQVNAGSGFGASPQTVTLTPANAVAGVTVQVRAVDDAIDEPSPHAGNVTTAATSSATPAFNGLAVPDISVAIIDNDIAGFTVSPTSGLVTTEAGGTASFTVRLTSEPTANVSVGVASNDASEGTAAPATLTFTPANWNVLQTVTVTGEDDFIADGNIEYTIVTAAATSPDPIYAGLNPPDVAVRNIDNDTAGVTVLESGGSTAVTEGGAGDSYTVVLASQPTANVTVNIAFDAAQLIVNGDTDGTTSLVFTAGNWNVAQAVSVFAVNDTVLESNPHTTTIVHSVTSTDGNYNGIGAAPVTVTITENDLASITLQGTASTVAETAGQANLTARLVVISNGTPGGTLSSLLGAQVVLTPGTAGQGVDYALATVAVDFPAGSTNGATRAIEVGIINDRLLEAAETFNVGLERTAGNGTVSGTHVVTIADDESGVFTFSQASGSTSEAAGTYNRSARLTITGSGIGTAFRIQDAASVALLSTPGTATTPADYTLSTTRLDVPANAASPLDLTFEAGIVNDAIDEPNETFTIGFGAVTGPGSLQASGTHVVTIVDDDSAGVVITESSGTANDNNITVTEGGAGSSIALVLTSQPTSEVQVSMTFNGTIIQAGSPTLGGSPVILTFTSSNWNVPQVVNVAAVNDGVAANIGSTNLSLVVGSADPNYVGIPTQPASPVVVRIIEDDVPGVTVTEPGGSTAVTEGGGTDTYTLVLTSRPSSNVTVTLSPSAQLTTALPQLVFSPTNWNVAQAVTVSAVDDGIVEGPDSGTVAHAVTSTDASYNGLTVAPVAVSITDNDSATVQFAPTSVSRSEATSPMAFTVTLSNPVQSGVTVTVNSAPGTASSPADFTAISNQTVTFAPNSTASQTVNVTIANDALDEDDESFTLTLSGLTATGDVTLPAGTATATGTIQDDDALPVLSVANVTQPEGNASNTLTFTVNLSPVSGRAVSFTRATQDGSAVSTGPSPDFVAIPAGVVTIPAGQTSLTIPVTINGDTVFEGEEQFTLNLTAVTNATPGSLSATATLTDDDQQPTTTTITSDLPDPSVVGQPYQVAVEVRAQTLPPLGTVSISDGTGASCSAPLTAGTGALSTMSCTLTSTSAGTKTLTATYAPANTAFGASSGTESHRVDPAATTLALAGPATVRFNTPASYTATLAVSAPGAGTPAGIVTVSSGAQSCTITLPTATPSCTLSFPTLGSRTVTAAFVPANGDFLAASSNPVQTLAFASTDLVVTKDNGITSYQPNDLLVYTVEVENRGPDGAPGVRILDPVPAGLTNVAWTCVAQGGAFCPSAGGAGGLDVVVQTMPSGSRLVYTYYGNVQGSVPEIVNIARVELPANGTLDDPAPGNNIATDIDRLELLFANGFEPSPVNGPSGAVPLPAIELRGLGGRVAWPLLDLGDRSGIAVRVYVRALDDTVEYALATRDGDGRLRLGPWQRFAATPTLRWTAEEDRGGWQVTSARLD